MHCLSTLGSLQLRVCIALCIFIVVATLPLHFTDIDPQRYVIFKIPKNGKNEIINAMSHRFDRSSQTLRLSYENRFFFPEETDFYGNLELKSPEGKMITVEQDDMVITIKEKTRNILSFTAQLPKPKDTERYLNNLDNFQLTLIIYTVSDKKHRTTMTGKFTKRINYVDQLHVTDPEQD